MTDVLCGRMIETCLETASMGCAVMGDTQFLTGDALDLPAATAFLRDMSLPGEAIQLACNPRRINYSIYGNSDAFLHAHVFPRYDWEEEQRRLHPVWKYPSEMWRMPVAQYCDERDFPLRNKIAMTVADAVMNRMWHRAQQMVMWWELPRTGLSGRFGGNTQPSSSYAQRCCHGMKTESRAQQDPDIHIRQFLKQVLL